MDVLRTPPERFASLPGFAYEARSVPVPTPGSVDLNLAYIDEGAEDAPVVLLLHGEPTWGYLYRKMIPRLVDAGLRTIAPDLIGFGRSDKPADRAEHSYERHVGWIAAFIKTLDLRDVILFCQDWGGLIGLRVAAEHHDRFAAIVASNTFLPTGDIPAGKAFLAWREFTQTAPTFDISRSVATGCVSPPSADELEAYDAPFPDESFKEGPRAMPSLVPITPDDPATTANRAAWEVLGRWEKPFVTAFGDSDPITRGGDLFLQAAVPGAAGRPHRTLEGAGHFSQEDAPEALVESICEVVS